MGDKLDDLRWIRVFSSDLIPRYLVEQVRDRDYSVEDFYKYQNIHCTVPSKDGPVLNPFHHLYVLVDTKNLVKGFLWFVIDPLSKDAIINTFSIDKEYWGLGKAVKKVSEYVKEIMKKLQLGKVYWLTNYPKHSERNGFKRSKSILMEYDPDREKGEKNGKDTDGFNNPPRRHSDAESTAAAALQPVVAAGRA